jgi:transcriptional antiterminator RfaH
MLNTRFSWELAGNERWFLVHTQPKGERKAEFHLRAQGFRIFLPKIQKTIRHARQLRTVRAPLFPRYLFAILDLERDRWSPIRSTIGVSRLVTTLAGQPIPVPAGIVESLIARSDHDVTSLDADMVEGQRVRILSGPFADLVGTLARLDEAGRVRVLLEMMGTAVPVAVHRSALMPAA